MKKRELEALVEAQAAEIADLRRRVEELEARPPIVTIAGESAPVFVPLPYITPAPEPRRNPWGSDVIWCETLCNAQ